MMQRLQELDASVFSADSPTPARLRATASVAVATVALVTVVTVLRDGAVPTDWLVILPALAVLLLATRIVARAPFALVRKAVVAAGLYWLLAKLGVDRAVAAPAAMLAGAVWAFATGPVLRPRRR